MRGPAKSAQEYDIPEDVEFIGVLSRKRTDHGIFEDPYKPKVKCWLKERFFYILAIAADLSYLPGEEPLTLDITKCKVSNARIFW
jgi:hypothetical protein